jgi:PAS domain S-box-containing protein
LQEALARAEEGDSLLSALMEYVPEGITIADNAGRLRMVSRYGQELLGGLFTGKTTEEVINERVVHQPDGKTPIANEGLPLIKALQTGEALWNQEIIQVNNKGEKLSLLCNAASIRNPEGSIIGSIVAWRDITELKAAEEALRRSHDELESLVAARTRDLSQTVDELHKEIFQRRETEEALRESQERLRLLANQLINAQEMERGRLSRDIHDDFGQSLMVLRMQLNAILKKNSPEPEIRHNLEKVVSYLLEVTDKVRRFSQDLSPPSLERLGLTEALRELFEDFQELYDDRGMIITADLDEIKDILPKESDIVIYRISQEFLTNTHKHSNATKMAMAMKVLPDRVAITLEDNGQGFDLDEIKNRPKDRRGLGLASIEERLKMLGSHFSLTTRAGLGTMLHFEILRPGKVKTLQRF